MCWYLFELGLRLRHDGCEMRLWRKLDSEILRYEGSFLMPRRRADSNAGFDQPCQRCKLVLEDSSTIREIHYTESAGLYILAP